MMAWIDEQNKELCYKDVLSKGSYYRKYIKSVANKQAYIRASGISWRT